MKTVPSLPKRYVRCPNCHVQYPWERLYQDPHDRPAAGKAYTVSCSVCGSRFDVAFSKRWLLPLKAVVRGEP